MSNGLCHETAGVPALRSSWWCTRAGMEDNARSFSAILLDRFARKNPLAASLRLVLEQLFAAEEIDAIFEAERDQTYTRRIMFSTVVEVMAAVVTGSATSVHAALQKRGETIGASFTAFYNKLNTTEPKVSAALARNVAKKARVLLEEMGGMRPAPLPGWTMRVVDGSHIASTERRIEALWGVAAGPRPGFSLVVFEPAAMLMTHVIPCEDAYAQERSLTPELLALVTPGDCWVADRNFCTQPILFGIKAARGHFIIRQHGNLEGELLGTRVDRGRTDTARVFEQRIRLTWEEKTFILRRITLELDVPTRDDDGEMHILTNLPENSVDAATVAAVYRKRWTIETAFGDLERWMEAEIAPLGYPRAAILAQCVGVMAYNAISTLLGALRATHGEEVVREKVSGYYIVEFGRDAAGAADDHIEAEEWDAWRTLPLPAAAALLKNIAARIDLAMIRKHKRGPKKPVPKRTRFKDKPHVSTKRLIDGTVEDDEAPE